MRERNELITTAELAGMLATAGSAAVRLHHLSRTRARPAATLPISPCPDDHTFEAGHIPGADFLDLQGEFSDQNTELRFMMPEVGASRGARSAATASAPTAVWCSYSIGTAMWATRFWWMLQSLGFEHACGARRRPRQMEGGGPRDRDRAGEEAIRRRPSPRNRSPAISSASTTCSRPATIATPSSSTRSARNSTRAWSRAATAGPAAFPAASTCRRRRCSIPQTRRSCRSPMPKRNSPRRASRKDKRVIAYCGGGISATIDLFQLHRLGYDNLTLYDGSMGEWAKDPSLPIETG